MRALAFLTTIWTLLGPSVALACGRCAPLVGSAVFNAGFLAQLLPLLAPLALIAALAWFVWRRDIH